MPTLTHVAMVVTLGISRVLETPVARGDIDEAIRRIRMAELRVLVTDSRASPLCGAVVTIEQIDHTFAFGTSVRGDALLGDGPDHQLYREHLRLFNEFTPENELKWPNLERSPQVANRMIVALGGSQARIRGHTLVYPTWSQLPARLRPMDPDTLRSTVREHVRDVARSLDRVIDEWDVLNEPYSSGALESVLGGSELIRWFELARGATTSKLFLNDYGFLPGDRGTSRHRRYRDSLIHRLRKRHLLDGIGVQAHLRPPFPSESEMWIAFRDAAPAGTPIKVTEASVEESDDTEQARTLSSLLHAAFASESVTGVILWGFWAGAHWRPEAALFRHDWTERPSARVWRSLVHDKWLTKASVTTDCKGQASLRVFKGRHNIRWHQSSRVETIERPTTLTLRAPATSSQQCSCESHSAQ